MAIETVLLFDTETTGTDPAKDQVVEAAGEQSMLAPEIPATSSATRLAAKH